jgi:hypothetical protein
MTNEIKIHLSKSKLTWLLAGSIVFAALGAWLMIKDPGGKAYAVRFTSGLAAILFFGFCGIYLAKKLRDNLPGLVINGEGIIDRSNGFTVGHIPWADIAGVTTHAVMSQRFILLKLKNPEAYINRQSGALLRQAMKMNLSMYGSPVSISANGLACNFDELLLILREKFDEYSKPV